MKIYKNNIGFSYLFVILIILMIQTTYQQTYLTDCHYSCQFCWNIDYAQCVICQPGFKLIPLSEKTNQTDVNSVKVFPSGSCLQEFQFFSFNVLGVALGSFFVLTFIISRNRIFFYYISSLQTVALFALLEIGYLNPLLYILQSFEWFMLLTNIQKILSSYSYTLYNQGRYRLGLLIYETDIQKNIFLIGPVQLGSFIIVLFASIIICLCGKQEQKESEQFNNEQKNKSFLSKINCESLCKSILVKIQYFFMTIFFLTIQQTILALIVGVRYSQFNINLVNMTILVGQAIILIVMAIIHCYNQLPLFPNKIVQMTDLLKRLLLPLFVILPTSLCYFIFFFMFLICIIQVCSIKKFNVQDGIVNSNKKITHQTIQTFKVQQSLKRQIWYRSLQLISIACIGSFYAVNQILNQSSSSQISSYVALASLCLFLICPFIQIFMQIKLKLKEQQSLIPQTSQNRNTQRLNKRVLKLAKDEVFITSQGFIQNSFLNKTQEDIFKKQDQKKQRRIEKQAKKFTQTSQNILNKQIKQIYQKPDLIVQIESYQNINTKRLQKTKLYTKKQNEDEIVQQKYKIQPYESIQQTNSKTFYKFNQQKPTNQKKQQLREAYGAFNKPRKARKLPDMITQI